MKKLSYFSNFVDFVCSVLMAINLKVLGCSGSETSEERPCSFLLGDSVLLDAGSVARALPIEAQRKIRAIYLTHCHLDHIKDLAFLAENVFNGLDQTITIFAHADVITAIRTHFLNNVIWPDFSALPSSKTPLFAYQPVTLGEDRPFIGLDGVQFEAVQVNHPGPTVGYLVKGQKNTVAYVGDTGPTEAIWQAMNRCDNLSDVFLECSFPNEFEHLANKSLHLTSAMLPAELDKLQAKDVRIHIYHLKAPYRQRIEREIAELNNPRLRILAAGDEFQIS